MNKKIAVLGTGAIGSCIGADLTEAGHDVLLIDQWPAHVEAMKARGLHFTMIRSREEFQVPVQAFHLCDLASLKCQFDIVFLACKSYDSCWMVQLIEPYLKSDGVLVSTQNSMNDEWIAPIIGAERDIGSAIELSADMPEPGWIKRNTGRAVTNFVVGELDGRITPRIQEVAQLLSAVGQTRVSTNIWGVKFSKLIVNTTCMTVPPIIGFTAAEMLNDPKYLHFSVKLGSETARVGTALGYVLEPAFGLTAEDFNCSLEEKVEKVMKRVVYDVGKGRRAAGFRHSVMQDLEKGRHTETDYLNGYVVKKGREVNVPTPINEAITSLMREIEQGKRDFMSRSNLEMLEQYM